VKTEKVALLIEEAAAEDRDDLIDAIAELIAAVFDMHRCLAVRHVLAADIGDARHFRSGA
jgi:hypothetical protein